MKRLFTLILLIFITAEAFPQLKIKEGSFKKVEGCFILDKNDHYDSDNMPMALIRIYTEYITPEQKRDFEFNSDFNTELDASLAESGEIELYASYKVKKVKITHPYFSPIELVMPFDLVGFQCYEVVIQGPNGTSEPVIQKQYLIVKADQPDALIYIDDIYVDKQFVHKQFDVGTTHTWRIECDLFRTESGTVSITEEENVVEVKMQPEYGFLNVSTTPENGAQVFIDDSFVGTTPYKSDKLSVGTYTVRVMKDDYKVKEDKVVVKDKETTEARMQMLSVFVNVTLNADSGSDIYVDDVYKGRGRWSGKLREGTYIVEARKESHRAVRKRLELIAGNSETISLGIPEPIYGSLNITSLPTDATVYIDGKQYGQTPKVISNLLIGTHELRLEKKGCASVVKTITVKEGETLSLNESLPTGKQVSIKTGENGDRIYVDDKYVGLSPMTVNLSYGIHHIKAERGRQTTSKTIDVKVGNTAEECLLVFGKMVRITSSVNGDDVYVDGKKMGQTPMNIDFTLGTHEVNVKRGKLYETKTIEVYRTSQSSFYFTPRKEPLKKYLENGVSFITLNGAYSVAPQTSFGITYGQVRKVGWFVSAMTNFNFRFSGEDDNIYNESGMYVFSGRSSSARLSVMAGGILKVAGPVYARLGLGYGMRVKCWEINDKWYEYSTDTYKGIDLSAGMQLNLRNVTLSADVVTTNFKTMEFNIGMGLNWKKR